MAKSIEYLNYKGEKWPIRVSYYAIKKFQEETGKELTELDRDISLIEPLLWYSLVAGHTAEGKPMTLKRDEMEFMLDESMDEFNHLMLGFFPAPVAKTSDEPKKK